MAIDLSGFSYFLPVLSYLFVFVVVYALLHKIKILSESVYLNLFVAFIIATIFIAFSSVRTYVENIVPWFVVLIIALFFVVFIVMVSQNDIKSVSKPIFWVFVIVLLLVFLFAAIKVFSSFFNPLLPGTGEEPTNSFLAWIKEVVYTERFLGAILLLILTAIVSWVITRK